MNYSAYAAADARLIILRELASQSDGRLNSTLIGYTLEAFGHRRSRDWVESQLNALEELGAVRLNRIGSVLIAELLRLGLDHVERRRELAGVARPSIVTD